MAKRQRGRRGEGSISDHPNGGFIVRVPRPKAPGAPRKIYTKYAKTHEEAIELRRKMLEEVANNIAEPSKLSVSDYLDKWLADVVRVTTKPNTQSNYEFVVERFLKPALGDLPLRTLAPLHVQTLLADMEKVGKSPRMRQLARAVLRRALKQAVRWEMVPRNAADGVDAPRVVRREMRYWEAPLVQKFFAVTRALERPIDAAFWELLILCGGRIGEVLGLRWSDVDWKNRTIHIQRTLLEIDGHIRGLQDNTKTEAGDRLVSLPDELMKLLETAHLKFRQEQQWPRKQQRPRPPELKEHMFLAESRGTPTFKRQSRVHREFSALCLKAGVPRIRIHDLRHTNATLLLSKGVDIKTVSTRLGHANVQVTLDLYAHVTQQMNEKAADALSEVLENEST